MFDKTMVRSSIVTALRMWMGILVLLDLATAQVHAQTLTTLASFNNSTGEYKYHGFTLIGNALYGTSVGGGSNSTGNVFSIPVSGGSPTVVASFNATGSNGGGAGTGLTLSGDTLYGVSGGGGPSNDGVVFSVPVSGGSPTAIASFSGSNGAAPYGSLTLSGNVLYGTTSSGGANGDGTVFSLPLSGGSPTVLASFNGANGQWPAQSLTLIGNTLFGTTQWGGADGDGTVFSLPLSGGIPTVLASFNGSNGAFPSSGLTLIGNTLYGTTFNGGSNNDGTVFAMPVSGGGPTVLASFNVNSCSSPSGNLAIIGNNIYGTTQNNGEYGYGTVFSVPVSGGTPTVLASFNGSDGRTPEAGVTPIGNTLYGTTTMGGGYGNGTVFALNIAPAIALANAQNATIITGGTGTVGMTVSNSAVADDFNLNYTLSTTVQSGSAALGTISSGTGSLAPGGTQSCTVSATSTNLGINTIAFTASDPNSSNLSQTATAALTVLDHATAAFANGSTTLNLSFGTLQRRQRYAEPPVPDRKSAGSVSCGFGFVLDYEPPPIRRASSARMRCRSSDLPPGATSEPFSTCSSILHNSGQFSGQYQFNLWDEQDLSGWAGRTDARCST